MKLINLHNIPAIEIQERHHCDQQMCERASEDYSYSTAASYFHLFEVEVQQR